MKKIIILILMSTLLFSEVCKQELIGNHILGNQYEQIVNSDNHYVPSVKLYYGGGRDISSGEKLNFSTALTGTYKSNSFYYWTSSCNSIMISKDARCGNITWQPLVETTQQCKVKLYFGDGDGKLVHDEMTFNVNPYDDSIDEDLDNSDISTTLLSQYNEETKKFKVAFQSHGAVDRVVVSYSFDNATWSTFFAQNLGTIKSSSQEHTVLDSDNHSKIYFKVESINSLDDISVMSDVYTLNYVPSKPYVAKGTEIPVAPRIYSLGSEVNQTSVPVVWQRVNDSKLKDNVSYYEIKVANNRAFDNARIINAGNNAKGENLYESCFYTVTGLEDGKQAYFMVRGVNSVGAGAWSNVERILVKVQDRPTLETAPKLPLMDAVGVSKSPSFRFMSSDIDDDELEFYVSLGEAPDKLYQSSGWIATHAQGTQEISYEDFKRKVALKPNTKYYWQVKVREQGRKSEYYGGEYITSPVWSFTTQAVGSDLAITNAELISEIKPDSSATFRVTIKNIGTEVARQERVQAFYKKEGNTFQFWDGSSYMQKVLASGESETLNVEVKFRDNIWEKNGVTYDNVLISGNSTVIFDFKNISDQDINSANNRKEIGIHYENAGLPIFEHFWVYVQSIYRDDKSKVLGRIGNPFQIYFGISDDTTVSKAIVDYRLNESDSWKIIKTITNDDNYLQGDFDWNIPDDRSLITDRAELRVRAYEANGVDYSEKSAFFPIYSNTLEMKNIIYDRRSHTVGDNVVVSYDLIHDYDIKSFRVWLKNPDTGEIEKIINDDYIELGTQPTGAIQFTIPNDNEFAGENVYLYIEMWDIHQNRIKMDLPSLSVEANTKLPSPFNSFMEVYKPLNTNFPTDTGGHSSYNRIKKIITDDNNIVHMLVASVASYYTNGDYKRYNNIDYYYMTYDYNSKELSAPLKTLSTSKENQIFFKDFTLVENEPFILFQKDASQYYLSHKSGSSFSSLQEVLNKSSIKNNTVDFAQYNDKLYIKWIDTENGTSSVDRRNKSKEVYPNIGAEENLHNEYLGYNTRVNNGHLYADCGRIFSLNSDFTVNELLFEAEDPHCNDTGEFKDFSTTHNVLDFLPISSGYGKIKLIKNDFTTVLLDDEKNRAEVAVYDDKIIIVGYLNNKNIISIYDNNYNKLSELSFGKYTEYYDVYAKADINKNKIMAVSRLEDRRAYLTVADLSNDITAPNITLSNNETTIEVGNSINLVWTAHDNNDELVRYEVYKVANGEESLLKTITNISTKSFTYTQESNTDKFIQLKVVAYDNSGNSNYDTLPLKVQKKITFNSFSINKSEMNLGDNVIFSWGSSGGDETTQFMVYKKAIDETEWSELFTTRGTSKTYVVKDFVGEYNFKIVFGSSSMETDGTLIVNGELLDFKEELFKPQNNYYKLNSHIKFEWVDTLTTSVLYDIWLKKSGENEFTNIGTTSDKYLDYFDDINGSFEWKVSARFAEVSEESSIISVNVERLKSPTISDINFTLVGNEPTISFSFTAINGIENYVIVKEHDGFYEEIPLVYQSSYVDTDINYDVSYDYSVLAVKDGIKTEQGASRTILASLSEQYEVIIDTADNQLLDSNALTIEYHPNQEVEYEKYEIWLGVDPDNLILYTTTSNRSYEFSNLKYATNYFIVIYPIDFNGHHISASSAKLSFTTGFDSREITIKPVITIGEVGNYSIDLNWTIVPNADEYKICRSDNGARYNCFVRTKELSYVDNVNIEPDNSYTYKLQAVNGFNYSISDASDVITTTLSDSLRVIRDVNALTFDMIKLENSAENNITTDLNLTKIGANGSVISWSSTSTLINVETGHVDRTSLANDLDVILEAFVKYGDINNTIKFDLLIQKMDVIDTDNDGIPDNIEISLGLNPNSNDSDGDGYLDSEEIGNINSPRNTDGEDEIDALDTDSDNDGVSDGVEREQGTNYLDGNDKPQTINMVLSKSNYTLGLGLRDINISIEVSDLQNGELKVMVLNEETDMLTTTQQWEDKWLDNSEYTGKTLLLTLRGLKTQSGLIAIEVRDKEGNVKREDILIEVIKVADFVESKSSEQMNFNDANATCIDMGARLATLEELITAYQSVDNYIDMKGIRTPIWGSTPSPTTIGNYSYIRYNTIGGWGYGSKDDRKYVHCVQETTVPPLTDLVTLTLSKGWNNVAMSPITLEELVAKIGYDKLLIVQGALPQSSYRKLFVDQGLAKLNSFKKVEEGQAYWIKVSENVTFTYSRVKYKGLKEIHLKAGWNNVASLYGLSLAEITEQLGVENVLIIQGALPQSSYRKLFVDQGLSKLNSFKKFEPNQGYWVKLAHEATLTFQFDLTEVARDNANNDLVRTETIGDVEYTVKLFTDSQPQTETSNGTIVIFGSIDGKTITMGLNSSYPNNSKFQVAVFNSNAEEVGRSEIVDFTVNAIDFGSFELLK